MINNIRTKFAIKDVENLSGVKAHTIRIWEKRYELFEPKRTETNIRYYSVGDLKKILNVALLVDKGRKISKVSKLTNEELREEVVLEITNSISSNGYENSILMAMLNFDQFQFETIYNKLTAEFSFRDIFNNLFIPLLDKIGLQWQSDTITPAHEHFISNLIYQKLHVNIEKVSQSGIVRTDKVFVLFLPSNEIHELGLLYIKYELSLKGYKTIYLGESVPVSSLDSLADLYDNIVYVSYFTVFPPKDKVLSYLERFTKAYLQEDDKLWVLGRNSADVDVVPFGGKVKTFKSIEGILSNV
jgi:DNA-binding transcriptional MerR regulator